jgi:hypothetical protein
LPGGSPANFHIIFDADDEIDGDADTGEAGARS